MSYTPTEFNQHLQAFYQSEIYSEFFEEGEIKEICTQFETFYTNWTTKDPSTGRSPEEEYFSDASQQLDEGDYIELRAFGHQQEPCRINVAELKVDYDKAREEITQYLESTDQEKLKAKIEELDSQYQTLMNYRIVGGSRGLHSKIASLRQIKDSANPIVPIVMKMDDSVGELPAIPSWSPTVRSATFIGKLKLLEYALSRLPEEEKLRQTIPSSEDDLGRNASEAEALFIDKYMHSPTKVSAFTGTMFSHTDPIHSMNRTKITRSPDSVATDHEKGDNFISADKTENDILTEDNSTTKGVNKRLF